MREIIFESRTVFLVLRNVLLIMALFIFSCCSNEEDENRPALESGGPIELPALRNGANDVFVSHSTTFNGKNVTTFSMEYDKSKKHSLWIAFRFDNQSGQTNVGRADEPFDFDPSKSIPVENQRERSDFGAKGYDRGHICASADRLYSSEANVQTFYYTNMSPQKNSFNTGVWLDLEAKVQNWGRSNTFRDTLYVVKGGTIDKENQIWTYISNDKTKPVPKYYFMAILCKKGDTYKSIGFWMDQSISGKPSLSSCAKTIDELEDLTGFDFFHNLPDKLENAVESQYAISAWPGIQ